MTEPVATGAEAPAPAAAQGAAPSGAAPAAAPASAPAEWYAGFQDEAKGYVMNKGWKDASAVVDSYRNLEKLIGAPPDQVLRLPKSDAKPEEWGKVWEKLGRPADPRGYDVGRGGDPAFSEWAQRTFFDLGLSKTAGEHLVAKFAEFSKGQQEAAMAKTSEANQQAAEGLKREWGAAYDQNLNAARSAAKAFGMDAKVIDAMESAMGFAGVMKFMHGLASRMGESNFAGGQADRGFGILAPEAAKARIAALRQDVGFTDRYIKGDEKARAEMEQLHKWAYES